MGFIYILASDNQEALYTGVTSDLEGRIWPHKKYHTVNLVYYEEIDPMYDAICREKQLKKRKRISKVK